MVIFLEYPDFSSYKAQFHKKSAVKSALFSDWISSWRVVPDAVWAYVGADDEIVNSDTIFCDEVLDEACRRPVLVHAENFGNVWKVFCVGFLDDVYANLFVDDVFRVEHMRPR